VVHLRPDRGFAAWPTNDDLTVVIAGWPRSELATNRKDIEGNFLATLEMVPDRPGRVQMKSAPGWIRTNDLPLRRRPLYPLSYRGSPQSG
jgi:hypothetical protein